LVEGNCNKGYLNGLEQIFSIFRHEMGNAVNSLKITLDVFHENFDQFDDDKKQEYLKRGMKIVSRQQEYIDALKSYASQKVKRLDKIEFSAFWKNFMHMASQRAEGRPIELVQHVKMDPCHLLGDMEALNQAMIHVFNNALEATEDLDNPRTECVATRKNNKALIVIKDNGVGIEDQQLSKIFYPFFTTKPERMGMGLAVVQKLLGDLGGQIEIESIRGKGTEAKMILPLFSH
jgi:C4-dicarboxylate-specific signal transduction histidine kinase